MSGDGERELLERCQGRDVAAFAQLYDAYVDRVYRHVFYLVGSKTDAEELTEQTFRRAWHSMPRCRWRRKPFPCWLLTIAHDLAMDRCRNGCGGSSVLGETSTPARLVTPDGARLRGQLSWAIGRLKPLEREVILLRFVEDLDERAVAEAHGTTVQVVRNAQLRGLRSLRRMLEVEERDARALNLGAAAVLP